MLWWKQAELFGRTEEQTNWADIIQEMYLLICRLMTKEGSNVSNHTEYVISNESLSY